MHTACAHRRVLTRHRSASALSAVVSESVVSEHCSIRAFWFSRTAPGDSATQRIRSINEDDGAGRSACAAVAADRRFRLDFLEPISQVRPHHGPSHCFYYLRRYFIVPSPVWYLIVRRWRLFFWQCWTRWKTTTERRRESEWSWRKAVMFRSLRKMRKNYRNGLTRNCSPGKIKIYFVLLSTVKCVVHSNDKKKKEKEKLINGRYHWNISCQVKSSSVSVY